LTNYIKYRRGIGAGKTIAPKSGVPTGVTMLPHHNIYIENAIACCLLATMDD
jgi:hypothetical protein